MNHPIARVIELLGSEWSEEGIDGELREVPEAKGEEDCVVSPSSNSDDGGEPELTALKRIASSGRMAPHKDSRVMLTLLNNNLICLRPDRLYV